MPKELERKLKATARRKFPRNKKRQDAYVYGTLRKTGWTPSHHNDDNHPKNVKVYEVKI